MDFYMGLLIGIVIGGVAAIMGAELRRKTALKERDKNYDVS